MAMATVFLGLPVFNVGQGASAAAAGSPGWQIQPVSTPPFPNGVLSGVSCATVTACYSVGSFVNPGGRQVALVERWNGTHWLVQPTPNPAGASLSQLSGVSCTSANACTAVGSLTTTAQVHGGGNTKTLAERWDGTRWSVESTPNPSSASDALNVVSCASAAACTAVGYAHTNAPPGSVTFAEHWNGKVWTVQSIPKPPAATALDVSGVSCTSATACTAVGFAAYPTAKGYHEGTIAERWDGSSWTIEPTPNPTGATGGDLGGVSCTSATACTAVGTFLDSSGHGTTLAEFWNGTTWSLQSIPTTGSFPVLNGVSCASTTACTAVGYYTPANNTPFAERWDGTHWSLQSVPNPSGGKEDVLFNGVSCASATACAAIGYMVNPGASSGPAGTTVAEGWNGTSWSVQPAPNPTGPTPTDLSGVACPSTTECFAVGSSDTSGALVERWNGTSWLPQSIATPAGIYGDGLDAVSCPSTTACTAVGTVTFPGSADVLAEIWNGTTWSYQIPPSPGGIGNSLNAVSCSSATACMAVGDWYGLPYGSGNFIFTDRWDGSKWSMQSPPTPSGATNSYLTGVSCTSATECTAVGSWSSNTSSGPLVERWNGTTWSLQSTPNPTNTFLGGVFCTSASACVAVGTSYNSTATASTTLVERWNGTSWSIQTSPSPAGATFNGLAGVSCASTSSCSAVGSSAGSPAPHVISPDVTLAEHWDGTNWTIQPTPNPPDVDSTLGVVSCASTLVCTAVGTSGATVDVPLVERYS